ncbi:MAG: hypothetical protein KGR24_03585, partial [Planctomycetes bacterium]|nr:hypothetical protein [Planctomycetota bacterium]
MLSDIIRSVVTVSLVVAAIGEVAPIAAIAGPITPGNLVIYRVGTGASALSTTGAAVFLDEYTTAGSLVQTITVPTTGSTQMVAVGNSTT